MHQMHQPDSLPKEKPMYPARCRSLHPELPIPVEGMQETGHGSCSYLQKMYLHRILPHVCYSIESFPHSYLAETPCN
jgi:hypothetical protein